MDNPTSAVDSGVEMKLKSGPPGRPMPSRSTFEEPCVIEAKEATQCGCTFLYGHCPRCGTRINLAEEGKHICIHCGNWLFLKKAANPAETPASPPASK